MDRPVGCRRLYLSTALVNTNVIGPLAVETVTYQSAASCRLRSGSVTLGPLTKVPMTLPASHSGRGVRHLSLAALISLNKEHRKFVKRKFNTELMPVCLHERTE